MNLEPLVQTLTLDGRQFMATLDQMERELRQTGQVGRQTTTHC